MAKTVLCVDDSASMRQMIRLTLAGGGYEVIEASDGNDGLKKVGGQPVNMVITDLNMPGMDGLTFIKELRKLAAFKGIPILFLTTESDEGKRSEAKAAGATAWITKPFQAERLLEITRRVIG